MTKKKILIDDKEVEFAASAAVPRLYRIKFRKDLFHDMMQLEKKVSANNEEESTLDIESLEVFENIAYIMAKHANRSVPDAVEDWLDQFQTLSIYQVLPQLIELWNINIQSDVQSKKISPN